MTVKDEINCDALVIGGGIVGLSIARNLQLNSIETILVEKNSVIGEEVSSRNSGVVHSGIYYKQGSLKASLCLRGNKLLHEYAALKNISLLKTGKLIIGENNEKGKIRTANRGQPEWLDHGYRSGIPARPGCTPPRRQ